MFPSGSSRFYTRSYDRDGRKTAPVRRTKRYKRVDKAARANWRMQKNLPITLTHEETSEVRAKAGTQGVVQFQAERRLPAEPTTNPQVSTGALLNDVNRKQNGILGTYNGGACEFDEIYRFADTTAEVRSLGDMNHRSDWTMFTNGSWRDGYTALNGRFNTAAKLQYGYITPIKFGLTESAETQWFQRFVDTARVQNQFMPVSPLQAIDYHHLEETLSITVTNNAVMPCSVTMYECTLAHDVPMQRTLKLAATAGVDTGDNAYVQWGGLPCPVELWRASRKITAAAGAYLNPFGGGIGAISAESAGYGAVQGDDGEGAVGTRMGVSQGAASAGYTGGNLSYFAGSAGVPTGTAVTTLPDVDHAGVRVGGQLLHHWYTVKAHNKTIPPGMTTTFTFKVRYNKRIPGTWWESLYGVAGMTKTFFMVTRPGMGVGSTGETLGDLAGAGARLPATGPTDLTMKWTKHKAFCRTDTLPRRHITYRATRPILDVFQVRNPGELNVVGDDEDADDAQAVGGGEVANDGNDDVEMPGS